MTLFGRQYDNTHIQNLVTGFAIVEKHYPHVHLPNSCEYHDWPYIEDAQLVIARWVDKEKDNKMLVMVALMVQH